MSMVWLAFYEAVGKALSKVPMILREKNAIQKNDSTVEDIAIAIITLLKDYWNNTLGMKQVGVVILEFGHSGRIWYQAWSK